MKFLRQGKVLPLLLLLSACSNQTTTQTQVTTPSTPAASTTGTNSPKIVATFLPMYWFSKAVAGDNAQVEILVPPGSEVHEYQATPANVQAIATANVLVKNGFDLEEFLESTIKNAQNSNLTKIEASQGIEPIKPAGDTHEKEDNKAEAKDKDHHEHEGGNPHVWLDPILAKKQVENIRDGLIKADYNNQVKYQANAAAYIQKLEQLDAEFKTRLQKYPNCTFVTFHDAFPYLASRYNLKQVAVVEIPETSLSPAQIQKTVETVKTYQVKALFSEPGVDNKLLDSLSKDLNLKLKTLDSMESGNLEPDTYFQVMRSNLEKIEAACQ